MTISQIPSITPHSGSANVSLNDAQRVSDISLGELIDTKSGPVDGTRGHRLALDALKNAIECSLYKPSQLT